MPPQSIGLHGFHDEPDEPMARLEDADQAQSSEKSDGSACDSKFFPETHPDALYNLQHVGVVDDDPEEGVISWHSITANFGWGPILHSSGFLGKVP